MSNTYSTSWSPTPRSRETHRLRGSEKLWVYLRWLAVSVWCVLPHTQSQVMPGDPLWLCAISIAYCSLQHFLAYRRKELPPFLILGMDLLLVAFLCLASGGLQSYAYVYFYGIILAAAIRFGLRQGLGVALASTVLTVGIAYIVPTTEYWSQGIVSALLYGFLLAGISGVLSYEMKFRIEPSTAERERRKTERLLALHRTLIPLDFDVLLQHLVEELIRLVPCRSTGLILIDRQRQYMPCVAGAGLFSIPSANEIDALLTDGVLTTALEQGTLLLPSSVTIRSRLQYSPQLQECAQFNLLIVRLPGQLFQGCLLLGDKKGGEHFTQEDIQLVTTVAEDAARIIEQAWDLQKTRKAKRSQHHLLRAIMNAQEQERKREVEEWHERLGSKLFQIIKDFRACQEMIGQRIPEMKERAEHLAIELDGVAAQMRNLTNELHPLLLEDFGFVETLREYVASVQERESFTVTLQADTPSPQLPSETTLSLYRITQEAVRNIRQHAHAKNVEIAFVAREQTGVSLMIKDDGQGFDPEDAQAGQYGLLYMRERAEACGGELHVSSARGQGTEIRVDLQMKTLLNNTTSRRASSV